MDAQFRYEHRHDFQVYGRREGRLIAFVVRASNPFAAHMTARAVVDHNGGAEFVSIHDYWTGAYLA